MTGGTTGLKPLIGRYCQVVSLCVAMLLHVHEGIADNRHALAIPAAQADVALKELSWQSGYPVIFRTHEVTAVRTNAIDGQFTVQEALGQMFEGTPLVGGVSLEEVVTVSFRVEEPTENTMKNNLSDTKVPLLKRLGTAIATTLFAISGGNAIAADEATDPERPILEEIVVTATYRDTAEMDTPIAISVVNEEMIEARGILDLMDLAQSMPSLTVTQNASSTTNVSIRGIESVSGYHPSLQNASTTSIYIDDTPVTTGQMPNRQISGVMFDLERVEVIKGPQGTLFGESSMAGTIRYISNKPDLNETAYKVQANITSMDQSDDSGYKVNAMVNIPLVQDEFAVRILGFSTKVAGYFDRVEDGGTTIIEEDVNSQTHQGARITALWQPSDLLSLRASVYSIQSESENLSLAQGRFFIETAPPLPPVPIGSFDELDQYNLVVEYEFPWGTVTSSTSKIERQASYTNEYSQALLQFFDWRTTRIRNLILPPVGDASGPIPWDPNPANVFNMTSLSQVNFIETDRFVQEFRAVSNTDGPFNWMAGFYYKESDENTRRHLPFTLVPAVEQYRPDYAVGLEAPANAPRNTLEEMAFFGDVSYELTDTWELGAGVRYTDLKQQFHLTGTGTDDQVVTPKVSLTWRPTDGMMYFGIVSTGFRPGQYNGAIDYNIGLLEIVAEGLGGVSEIYTNWAGAAVPISESIADLETKLFFDGDEVVNYELGAKVTISDNIRLTGSVFYFDWTDTLLYSLCGAHCPQTPRLPYHRNSGDAYSKGIEANALVAVTENLSLQLGARYLEAEVDNAPAPNTKIPDATEWKWHASVTYAFPVTDGIEGDIRLDWMGQDESFSDAGNNYRIPPRNVGNMRVTIRDANQNQWRLALFGKNLANDDSLMFEERALADAYHVYMQPRSYGLEFTYEM